ncbi:hypothetical protein, partial [Heyndrickxia sporothermodurans]
PEPVLDALFEGDESAQRDGVGVFDYRHDHRPNPADEISCEQLIAWCDQDQLVRYQLAASFVTFACHTDERGPRVWSEQAKALLSHGPNPESVLSVFIRRFRPTSWSGSRAALMEANALLLDSLMSEILAEGLSTLAADAKKQFALEIAAERQRETDQDRARDERFE